MKSKNVIKPKTPKSNQTNPHVNIQNVNKISREIKTILCNNKKTISYSVGYFGWCKKGFFYDKVLMMIKKYKRQMSFSTHNIIQSSHNCGAVSLVT